MISGREYDTDLTEDEVGSVATMGKLLYDGYLDVFDKCPVCGSCNSDCVCED